MALSRLWVPDPDASIQASRRDPPAVEGNSVDLTEMAGKGAETASLGDAPYPRSRVIAA
jgi:hypothetical protein